MTDARALEAAEAYVRSPDFKPHAMAQPHFIAGWAACDAEKASPAVTEQMVEAALAVVLRAWCLVEGTDKDQAEDRVMMRAALEAALSVKGGEGE